MQYTFFQIANWFSYNVLIDFSQTLVFIVKLFALHVNIVPAWMLVNILAILTMKQSYQADVTEHRLRKRYAVAYHYAVCLPYITIAIDKSKKQ